MEDHDTQRPRPRPLGLLASVNGVDVIDRPKRSRLNAQGQKKRDRSIFSPSRLTPEVVTDFCKMVRRGLPFDSTCDYLGIRSDQFWAWLRRGETYLNSNCSPEIDKPYGEFVQQIKAAFAEYKLSQVEELQRKGNRNWFRNLLILERRDRKNFGKTEAPGGTEENFDIDEKFL